MGFEEGRDGPEFYQHSHQVTRFSKFIKKAREADECLWGVPKQILE